MKHPTWDDIRRFCEVDGWVATHVNRQRKRRDHDRFTKTLANGTVLRTRVSHGSAQIGDPALVNHIITRQMQVTHEQFWAAVQQSLVPTRDSDQAPTAPAGEPAHHLDDWLAVALAMQVGLPDDEIAMLAPEDALQRWLDWCARDTRE